MLKANLEVLGNIDDLCHFLMGKLRFSIFLKRPGGFFYDTLLGGDKRILILKFPLLLLWRDPALYLFK